MLAIEIPFDTADAIVVAVIQRQVQFIEQEQLKLDEQIESGEFEPCRDPDYMYNKRMLAHMKAVLAYFGDPQEEEE